MKKKQNKNQEKLLPEDSLFALADINRIDPETSNTIPSDLAVEEAREWINLNEK